MTNAAEKTESSPTPPVVTITSGNPTAEEVAALTVLFAAMSGAEPTTGPADRRGWSRPARRLSGGVTAATGWGRI